MPETRLLLGIGLTLGEVTIYLAERCRRQVGGGVDGFVVTHSPPSVIDTKDAAGRGDEGIDAAPFLDWAQDYQRWWFNQSCGPLGGLIEPPVSVFDFITF